MSADTQSPTIEIMEDGPLVVKGLERWQNSKGDALPVAERIALCRCGASGNKPYCDGTHVAIEFSGKRETSRPLDGEKSYVGKKITVHDNRIMCCHAAECVEQLSSVFRLGERPWIEPEGAQADEIVKIVDRCPSGALSYSVADVHYRDQNREAKINIAKDGPYNIEGGIVLLIADDLQPPSKEHYSFCRCGASKNKPYCDGSHRDVTFEDPDN